ncbi:right-handed parallel beta-helix repeat-containing protein [Flavilitoribacter nigricans]|uniref:Periplasmic copper-binding protein NosD beta helix domain-containing protein n=1 Tax=Flavilitoribacter nigricans (strain ATCC 23147 / DSM 23189 / NBRC 102662 / NCIMB 1420 / SS-2) TaxID=1122177 RepID=A0A2D0N6H9_FLAN2|nr:right-handed parallel beta-helix repeat-containing protein [Flavilitoribacter nigricans]PHN04132.1 hypothetical protein CRP01_23330 [Flavilitoribacter nigricans DSM 23189 = NBRC 102662]
MYLKLLPVLALMMLVFSACQKEIPTVKGPDLTEKQWIDAAEQQIRNAREDGLRIQLQTMDRIPANAVELPAGSVDGLAAAIAEAGAGGTVLVKAGEHHETRTVVIDQKVSIIGEAGAEIISGVQPPGRVGYIQPALHLLNAEGVLVHGLSLRADSDYGGTGILIQNAPKAFISQNTFTNFGIGILNHHGDRSYITRNTIVGSSAWQTDLASEVHGVVNMNGDRVRIFNNHITNTIFGIWACDEDGLLTGNTTNSNFIGLILCKVPTALPLADGTIVGSENAGKNWITHHNTANGNYHVGIIVIDGANNNLLIMNKAADNVDADVELAGDTERFGFLTPTSFDNKVISASGISIKDCGINNSVNGGDLVDTSLNPCY